MNRLPVLLVAGSLFFGMVQTLPADTYQTWAASNFTSSDQSNSGVSGMTANPSGDRVANLEKYAFDLDPYLNSQMGLPNVCIAPDGNLVVCPSNNYT